MSSAPNLKEYALPQGSLTSVPRFCLLYRSNALILADIAVLVPCTRRDTCLLASYGKRFFTCTPKSLKDFRKRILTLLVVSTFLSTGAPSLGEARSSLFPSFSLCLSLIKEFYTNKIKRKTLLSLPSKKGQRP